MELSPSSWQHWTYAVLALFTAIAIDSDLRVRRIPNVLVLCMAGTGVALHTLGPANGAEGVFAYFPGALGLTSSLLGVAAGLLLFLPLYALRAMGAGDVKFMAALGAYTGAGEALGVALFVLAAGGVLGLVFMVCKRKSGLVLRNLGLMVQGASGRGSTRFDPATHSAERMPYALAFAAGLLAYGYWRHAGHPALLGF